jgi:hypothetical protein
MWLAVHGVLGLLQLIGEVHDPSGPRLAAVEHLIAEIDARLAGGGLDGRAAVLEAERRLRAVVDGIDASALAEWRAELETAQARLETLAGQLETLRHLKRRHGAS